MMSPRLPLFDADIYVTILAEILTALHTIDSLLLFYILAVLLQ